MDNRTGQDHIEKRGLYRQQCALQTVYCFFQEQEKGAKAGK